jgi:branched-chain amino acid transport system permease protein
MSNLKLDKTILPVTAVVFAFGAAPLLDNDYWTSVFIIIALNVLLAASVRTIFILNEISLGQVGFALIGAYTSALLTIKLGLSIWIAMPCAAFFSAFIAFLLGYPFLRLKGMYFSILTLMTAEIFRLIAYSWKNLTGGQNGLSGVPVPSPIQLPFCKISFDVMSHYYYLTLVVVILSLFILYFLEHSHLNRKWRAIRDADNLALSVGINIMRYKVLNFTIAGFFAGIAGALFAHYQQGLNADLTSRFGVLMSLNLVILMVVGGKGKFSGPIIGAVVIELLFEFTRFLDQYRPMVIGVLAIVIILAIPEGLVGIPSRIGNLLRRGDTSVPKHHQKP